MKHFHWLVILLISLITAIFSFFFVHFTSDNVMLFTATRFFQSYWMSKGVFPFFSPNMYAGIPYAFDMGLPNFHPFNLLFLIPYPYSYAIFVGCLTFLFLSGFYKLFHHFSEDRTYSLFLTLILFFSGSGFIRLANPTVYATVAHMGWFAYFLLKLHKGLKKDWFFAILTGILLTFSGQIPIVIFGYILGLIICVYGKVPWKKVAIYYGVLFILTSWYFILSIPLNITSTRMTTSGLYQSVGNLHPLHIIAYLFPYLFGELRSGSRWFMDIPYQTYLPILSVLFGLIVIWKSSLKIKALFIVFFLSSIGLIHLPFLRGAVQIYILLQIVLIVFMAKEKTGLIRFIKKIYRTEFIILGIVFSGAAILFFQTTFFSTLFFKLYHLVKKAPSLFYDGPTIVAIGKLISHNFIIFILFSLSLLLIKKYPKYLFLILSVMVIIEGLTFNYLQMYFIPTRLLVKRAPIPSSINKRLYRVQSISDTIAYTGYFVYQENITFRPPFSKEQTQFTEKEQKDFATLRSIFASIPTSWSLVENTLSVQGYSTFVPKKICDYFRKPSEDWKKEYDYIIQKNPLFGIKVYDLCVNNIETSRITMYDPRWEQLAVRYFISDRPLKQYTLLEKDGNTYFYENKNAPSMYRYIDASNKEEIVNPVYIDPNKMVFDVKGQDVGKKLVIIINPDGFVVKQNGKELSAIRKDFNLIIPIKETGMLTVGYSPIYHLQETIRSLIQSSRLKSS